MYLKIHLAVFNVLFYVLGVPQGMCSLNRCPEGGAVGCALVGFALL